MNIDWLEDFLSLAATASFSRSAEARHVTQPALSRRIRQLEDWIGATLVDRATFPVRLTPAGEAFATAARDALRILHDIRDQLRGEQGARTNTLTFASVHTLSLTFFPRWIRHLETDLPGLRASLTIDHSSMALRVAALSDGACDFLLTYAHRSAPFILDTTRFADCQLGSERIIPVSAPGPSGQALHSLDAGDDKPAQYLSYGAGSFMFHVVQDLIDVRRPRLAVKYENSTAEGLKAMALEGWGLAWTPESIVSDDLARGRLVRAGAAAWDREVDIRIYRSTNNRRRIVERAWASIRRRGLAPADPIQTGERGERRIGHAGQA
jgi:DNA-binding transcriptional LysR family regulator